MLRDLSPGAAAPGAPARAAVRAGVVAAERRADPVTAWSTGPWRVLALLASDAVALLLPGLAASYLTTGHLASEPASVLVATLVPLFLAGYGIAGLYPGFGVSAIQLIRTLSRQTSLMFLAITGCAYAFPVTGEPPMSMFVLWWMASLASVPMMRARVSSIAVRFAWWRQPVFLFGSADRVSSVIVSLAKAQHLGYRPIAVVLLRASGQARSSGDWTGPLPVIDEEEAIRAAREFRIRTSLLALPGGERRAAELRHHFRHVILVNDLEAPLVEPSAVRYLGSAIGIEYRNGLLVRRNQLMKRIIDVALAVIGLIALFPVAILAAAAIMVCSPGRWWHAQLREGRNGVPFRMWKLRTMYEDAEERLTAHLGNDEAARAEWNSEFKLSRDPRIIPFIGGVLRRWSLDEYPQFWNVIRGDMSLVGPRALPPYHLDAFSPEFRALRAHVRPGITGMWQVMSRGRGAIGAQEGLDRYYIYNWSIWMDLFVLVKTVLAVLTRRGAR